MGDLSRRRFLTKASMGVAAGVGAAGLASVPGLVQAAAAQADQPDLTPLGEDVVVHVRDASTGELAVLVDSKELVYRDPGLVARVLKAARRARLED
jgi:hypothetical protein